MKNKKGKKEKLKMKNPKRGKLFGGTVPPNNTLVHVTARGELQVYVTEIYSIYQ